MPRSGTPWERIPTENFNPWDPNSRYTFSTGLNLAGNAVIYYMARNIPAFDYGAAVMDVLGTGDSAPDPQHPVVPVDLYDFVDALTNEYKIFKDLVPEIDP
eukprot:CAMPEP_0168314560 /NCGR_PEP_ID=MMETSP0210-20121227/8954_1 /TAXON_ID=40633 /ORGANISM="Condylostoma magnum, Strain COL2" /LENGTH=100 /DNA_ID=CAMNT_0008284021 /DNA_START=193 /DNA_END=495 /DNA_ORIENTATION=+